MDAVAKLALDRAAIEPVGIQRSQYETIAANFEAYRASLLAGKLPPVGLGAGLGAARAISEWNIADAKILNAVEEIEHLYRTGAQ
ncbi:hypothetical protein ASE00_16325 [Sphingomonas sp. Root710]|nr:hypothetical protein ASE00_16325 [Sphingomonas sp. Root710]